MAILGLSLILASAVIFWVRKPAWLLNCFRRVAAQAGPEKTGKTSSTSAMGGQNDSSSSAEAPSLNPAARDALGTETSDSESEQGQTTPKASASAANRQEQPVPTFSLSDPDIATTPNSNLATESPLPSAPGLMAPPPRPRTTSRVSAATPSSSLSPLPRRGPSARAPGTSTLAPPPTVAGKPAKPSRKVVLEPGHSPLDWARLSASSDLRGLPGGGGYMRVGPAQLRRQNGRRGADAWMALGGRVYNVQPYADFHPGGVGELMRGAGKDGGKLFNEAHPWVNYEGMLASCLIGPLAPDGDEGDEGDEGGRTSGAMEEMD